VSAAVVKVVNRFQFDLISSHAMAMIVIVVACVAVAIVLHVGIERPLLRILRRALLAKPRAAVRSKKVLE
jgi:peptidoglycan/LPS O-acetylase OafA/YrhL